MKNTSLFVCFFIAFLKQSHAGTTYNLRVQNQPSICACEYRYNPVCGSDGITYFNDCTLSCANDQNTRNGQEPIYKVKDSECEPCICESVDLPVCTLDGLTFPNECELSCDTIRRIYANQPFYYLAYRAACLGPSTSCTTVASPVCGTDNILYRNKCVLETASSYAEQKGLQPIKVRNNGACLDACLCPKDEHRVCGSDGCFYTNACYLACQNKMNTCSRNPAIQLANIEQCIECTCEYIHAPVCGTNGKTYLNICELNCETKRQRTQYIAIASDGYCSSCYCTNDDVPVCGTDFKTYPNECELRCANSKRIDGSYVGIRNYGECHSQTCSCYHCPSDYQPTCGSDGKTYQNLCTLNCEAECLAQNQNTGQTLFLKKRGPCDL